MSRRKTGHYLDNWIDEGPRPAQGGTGVGWPIGVSTGQEASRVNAIDYERGAGRLPLSPEFRKASNVGNIEPEGIGR